MLTRTCCLLLFVCLWWVAPLASATGPAVVALAPGQQALSLAGQLQASAPGTAYASPEAALAGYRAGEFRPVPGHLARGYGQAPVWLALNVDLNALGIEPAVLEVGPAFLDRVAAWLAVDGGRLQSLGNAGDQVPPDQTPLRGLQPAFFLHPPHGLATVLLRLDTTSTQVAMVTLYRLEGYLARTAIEHLVLGGALAIGLTLVLVALGQYAAQRKPVYLLWLAYVGATTGVWFCVDGLVYRHLPWRDLSQVNTLTSVLAILSLAFPLLLITRLFDLRRWVHRVLAAWGWLLIGATVLGVLLGSLQVPGVMHLLSAPLLLVAAGVIVQQMLRGERLVRRYGLPLLVLALLSWHNLGANLGWFSYGYVALYGWQVAGLCNLILLQWGFIDQVRRRNRQLEAERHALNDQLSQQNQVLEARVADRTQELQAALTQVRQAETRQRQLLSMASHEFRTPSAVIKASLDSLRYLRDQVPADVAQRLANMRQASQRLIELANDLIRQDRLQDRLVDPALRERLELGGLLRELVAQYPHGGWLRLAPTPPCWVDADPGLLKIALNNLMHNAERHGQGAAHGVEVRLSVTPGQAHVAVADRGPGVPEADRSRIFERYVSATTDPGSGLGLPIVRDIAHTHGGGVAVHGAQPTGSVFVFSLPCRTRENAAAG